MTEAFAPPPGRRLFTQRLAVQPDDIDQFGHVNNMVYVRWVQDMAGAHWAALAPAELQAQFIWFVLRHEIDYRRPAYLDSVLEARTWVGAPKGARFDRFVQIRSAADGAVHAEARTTWAMIDAATRRPLRVPKELVALFMEE